MLNYKKIEKDSQSKLVWPPENLELVGCCPMCQSENSALLYSEVEDWAFKSAPGVWGFYSCLDCKSLYLNPRPTQSSIHKAYGKYYTHESDKKENPNEETTFKAKLHNEFMFYKFGIESSNRLNLKVRWYLSILNPFVYRKFPLDQLATLPRGSILDVGCGNGDFLVTAKLMGYTVYGLEIDPQAFLKASGRGLSVFQGSYKMLNDLDLKFDYIVCSHVIEHVHDPVHFLNTVIKVAKPSTKLILAWPNPNSIVLKWFQKYWRGLEAPRHLCLPSIGSIVNLMTKNGWSNSVVSKSPIHTFGPSVAIKYGKQGVITKFLNKLLFTITSAMKMSDNQDIVEIVFTKNIETNSVH